MNSTTMRPDDDELIADLQRYFAATEVDEPPFRTRVADSVSVRVSATNRRRWLAAGGAVAVAAALVGVVVPLASLHGGGPSVSTTALAPLRGTAGGASGSGNQSSPAFGADTTHQGANLQAPPQTATGAGAGQAPGTTPGSGAKIVVGTPQGKVERSVSASYTVPSGAFLTSFDSVISRAVGLGGYVVSSSTAPDSSGRIVSGTVTVKVPSASLADFVNGMPGSFQVGSVDFSSVDHTADYTDLSAQLASAQAELAALNTLLTKATALGDIISLEQQIAQVQSQIDSYQGQINVINNQVDLSTASVQLSERGAAPAPSPSPNPVKDGLGGGWSNAVAVTGAILSGLVTILPLLAIAAVILGVAVVLRRRRA